MAKNKNESLSLIDLPKSLYDFKIFTRKVSEKNLIFFSLIMLAILSLLTIMVSRATYNYQNYSEIFSFTLIALPLLLFITYCMLNLFMSAYEKLERPFFEGFFVFTSFSLMTIFIGNILNMFRILASNRVLVSFLTVVLVLVSIYLTYALIRNLSVYYKISWQRIFVSFIFTSLVLSIFTIIQYLVYIISLTS